MSTDFCLLNLDCSNWVVDTTGSDPFLDAFTAVTVGTFGTDCFLPLPFANICSSLGAIFAFCSLSADDFIGSIPGKGFTSPNDAPVGFAGVAGLNGRAGLALAGGFGAGVLGACPMGASSSETNKFVHFKRQSKTEFVLR